MSDVSNVLSETAAKDYHRLRESAGRLDLTSFACLELTGEDRKGWLQGQATNDLRPLNPGTGLSFCLCSPTGHLEAVADVWALEDRFLVTTARETARALLKRVETHVIMEDVEIAVAESVGFSIQGPAASQMLSELFELPNLDAGIAVYRGEPIRLLRSNRTGFGGWDIWMPSGAQETKRALVDRFEPIAHSAYNVARLEAGLPLFGADMNHRTLPPEMGPAFVKDHVSYTKGCYVGQEVLMRIYSRGHTNRTWMALISDYPLEPGATVAHPSRAEAGTVTSAVVSPDFGPIAGAMLRTEAAVVGETVRVRTERGEVEAEVRQMPILRLN